MNWKRNFKFVSKRLHIIKKGYPSGILNIDDP